MDGQLQKGTFTATGQSVPIVGDKVYIDLTFAGAATVVVEWSVDDVNWRPLASKTASEQFVVDAGGTPVRLNCTAYTNNVSWAMRA